MEKKNYLTASQNKLIATKISPLIKLIELRELAQKAVFIGGCDSEIAKELTPLGKRIDDVFIEMICTDYATVLEDVYCVLLNSEDEKETKSLLGDLGIN
ncbi:hypothetical protein ACWOE5_09445 [Aerococcus sanguinicola]|uniref:Uncharacterized protein n=1 Tax=Aerococcus sanguinicola TaxID=119206 RepID=A0A0X8FBR5_9LACT|nr:MULTISPECIES: hypothetical protein [Aerococcus]AMB94413.1 hypothetical protein AWM72_06375 [Aerococcus sanguinicola]MDK7051093.1 hypothetical protein [Aerococcus sanguinicola]OFT94083.1 hypothetical protein HMPREF3090_06075 [Aerococcus sp. HMSC23C02]PKZ20736.1 hypothetical protein CYJ28_09640 [Aerococcus sanguinicola]